MAASAGPTLWGKRGGRRLDRFCPARVSGLAPAQSRWRSQPGHVEAVRGGRSQHLS
jgi:hypothetical protein